LSIKRVAYKHWVICD